MKVILRESIAKLGRAGDVVAVARGYAQNYLIPQKKVLEATTTNLKLVASFKKANEAQLAKEKQEMLALAEKLQAVSVEIKAKTGEGGKLFGSVTAADIAAVLNEKGFAVDKKKIDLPEPLHTIGLFSVTMALDHEVKAVLKVQVLAEVEAAKEEKKPKKTESAKKSRKA